MALVELPRRAAPNFMESGRLAAAIDERISRSRDGVAPARCGRSAPRDCSAVLAEREFLGIAVSLSADVLPELRQCERAMTGLANAFLQPPITRYIARTEA